MTNILTEIHYVNFLGDTGDVSKYFTQFRRKSPSFYQNTRKRMSENLKVSSVQNKTKYL